MELQKQAMSYNTPLDRDSRGSFINTLSSHPGILTKLDHSRRNEVFAYAKDLADRNVQLNPQDTMMQLEKARLCYMAARFNSGDKELSQEYLSQALEAVNKAISSSPERIPPYFVKGQVFLAQNNTQKAINTFEYASSLNDNYYDAHCHLARLYFRNKQEEQAYSRLDKCLNLGGAKMISSEYVIKKGINHYIDTNETDKLLVLYERLVRVDKKNGENWMKLAELYASQGQTRDAQQAARRAKNVDPGLASRVNTFLNQLQKGDKFQFLPPEEKRKTRGIANFQF